MAQRYGRRRRRAHLQRIARLECRLVDTDYGAGLARMEAQMARNRCDALIDQIREWDADVHHMLGPHSALKFELPEIPTRGNPAEIVKMIVPNAPFASIGPSNIDAPSSISYRIQWLRHMLFEAKEEMLADLRTYMRLRITNDAGPHAASIYAFSESYWEQFRRHGSRRDIMRLARDIAEVMLRKAGEPVKQRD